jgi:predicted XRE-type DNA-binding protein
MSNSNPFAVLGLAEADLRLAKAELSRLIDRTIRARGLTQVAAAQVMGVAQPDVSDLVRGRVGRFSLERLERLLVTLDMDVTIRVEPRAKAAPRAAIRVEYRGRTVTPP